MKNSLNIPAAECSGKFNALQRPAVRAAFLFFNFFLIITALYQLKPASRSLFIDALGAEQLPYVWIITALTMAVFIAAYHRMVVHYSRIHVVLGTTLVVAGLLVVFRILFDYPGKIIPISFYVFVDIQSVVLVEQFWSLTDAVYTTRQGKSWYGFVGTGGLVGGVTGGGISALLIKYTSLQTPDLLVTAAVTVGLISVLTWLMGRIGLYCEVDNTVGFAVEGKDGWRALGRNRYLLFIAAVLLLAQLVSPLIDYQFLNAVEASYPAREARTEFLSIFFSVLGLVSIGINLVITPVIHRVFGAIIGLLIQPLLISLIAWCFLFQPTLFFGAAGKISDRGLSYSINRASKELLYIPIDPVLIYRAKAWIDMFGYRLFKVSGSLLILLFTQWLPVSIGLARLSWISVAICGAWIALIMVLRQQYQLIAEKEG